MLSALATLFSSTVTVSFRSDGKILQDYVSLDNHLSTFIHFCVRCLIFISEINTLLLMPNSSKYTVHIHLKHKS